jgi:hypothetical protein
MMTDSLSTVLMYTTEVCLKVGQFYPSSRFREKDGILLHAFRVTQSRATNPHASGLMNTCGLLPPLLAA